ncbi:MAG: DUF4115 domain-containing protein [Bryobacterales bacterium]|nr:DUF4115 domain-containing protein [Bryobacterales bacterium]
MARLRIRIELDLRGREIPVDTIASFAFATSIFLVTLSRDIGLEISPGRWVAGQFGKAALRFTAEFLGAITAGQTEALQGAFLRQTPLRLPTVANLLDLATAIEPEEAIGFGLYAADEDAAPSQWLVLTRAGAGAARSGIDTLLEANAAETVVLPPGLLEPAGSQWTFGAGLEAQSEGAPLVELRDLAARVAKVETVAAAADARSAQLDRERIPAIEERVGGIEASLKKMLAHIDEFCESVSARFGMAPPAPVEREPEVPQSWLAPWMLWAAAGVLLVTALAGLYIYSEGERPPEPVPAAISTEPPAAPDPAPPAEPSAAEPEPAEAAPPLETAAAQGVRVTLAATADSWMTVFTDGEKTLSRLLPAGDEVSFEGRDELRIRLGVPDGVTITWNGRPLEPVAPRSGVRMWRFTRGGYEDVPVTFPIRD